VSVGPAFVGVSEVAKGRAREQVGGPKQEVQKFLGLGLHGRRMEDERENAIQSFVAYATKDCQNATFPSTAAGGRDFGDVDLVHFHHRGEFALDLRDVG